MRPSNYVSVEVVRDGIAMIVTLPLTDYSDDAFSLIDDAKARLIAADKASPL